MGLDKNTYFDNASTSYVYPEVLYSIMNILEENWGNPNNLHSVGIMAKNTLESARNEVAEMLGVDPSEIIFTSCASESNALAINGAPICYCSPYEHHDIKENSASFVFENDDDIFAFDDVHDRFYMNEKYAHILVNNETGEIFDLKEKIDKAHRLGLKVLVDATQALGNIEVKPYEIGADYMSFSLHKCHAPKGIGVLFVKKGVQVHPLIYGSQEGTRRGGTQNVAYAKGGAIAMRKALKEMPDKNEHCKKLRNIILGVLEASHIDYIVNEGENNVPSILNIAFKNISGESMMLALEGEGFIVSTGSACNSGDLKPSEVLTAMNVPSDYIQGAIRISMSLENTETDAYNLAKAIIIQYSVLKGE